VHRENVDRVNDQQIPSFDPDFPFDFLSHLNRAGFEYQGDYAERSWTRSTLGYYVEDENGDVGEAGSPLTHGQRLNNEIYAQQELTWRRISAVVGGRFVHNSKFGNSGLPEGRFAYLVARGGKVFSGTRLTFSYGKGFKEPRLEETFAGPPLSVPNPGLQPERSRSFEIGIEQELFSGKSAFTARYFNNLFHDQIVYPIDPNTFIGRYINLNKSLAHGAEIELQSRLTARVSLTESYTYTSTQILQAPDCTPAQFCDTSTFGTGRPLYRRPKHSATVLGSYLGSRWGAELAGSFVGPRPDTDFYGFGFNHTPGYVLINAGGWCKISSRVTAYINGENLLNKFYEEVVGYPALGANFRVGMRFRIGGE
jgi:vitamin B12 transporter